MAVLNDAGAENVFKHLAREITEVSFAFYAQTISQTVQCFDYNPKRFRDWVIQMKLGTLLTYCLRQTLLVDFNVDMEIKFLFIFSFYFCIFIFFNEKFIGEKQ